MGARLLGSLTHGVLQTIHGPLALYRIVEARHALESIFHLPPEPREQIAMPVAEPDGGRCFQRISRAGHA
jgi:hypothetical protein